MENVWKRTEAMSSGQRIILATMNKGMPCYSDSAGLLSGIGVKSGSIR